MRSDLEQDELDFQRLLQSRFRKFYVKDDSLACPYFMPLAKLENGSWPHPARLPLGCGWSGRCTAPGHEGEIPTQDILEAFCNLGYASSCSWAPQQRTWDAIRFAVSAPDSARSSDPGQLSDVKCTVIRIDYVCERAHRPVEHGQLKFDLSIATWLQRHDDARIQRMAECFLETYLNKRA